MTELLLTEEVFLLGHDDESGKNRMTDRTAALAGALLLDLALADLIEVEGKKIVPGAGRPEHALLADALQAITAEKKHRSVSTWLTLLPSRLKGLDKHVGRALAERGILGEEKAEVLGIFPSTRWPERDPMPERQLRARLTDVLLERAEPAADDIALIALLQSHSMIGGVVDKPDRKQARKTAEVLRKQAEKGDVVSKAVGQAVRATQAAVMASVIAASAAASTAAVTGN